MSSNKVYLISVALALIGISSPNACADQSVSKVFHQLDKEAQREWHKKPISDENLARKEAIKSGRTLLSHVRSLSPDQLVDLIKRCKHKIHEIPSDSQHERYFDYFEQAILFSIRRLGDQKTVAAKEALDKIKPIITGGAHLEEVWDEAKAKQAK